MTLYEALKRDEGSVRHLYYDSMGVPTIGIGCNLTVRVPDDLCREITISEIGERRLFELRIEQAREDLQRYLPWTSDLDDVRQEALINLVFNMGIGGLLTFERALSALKTGDYVATKRHLLDSKYARQVGDRAQRVGTQLETGVRQ